MKGNALLALAVSSSLWTINKLQHQNISWHLRPAKRLLSRDDVDHAGGISAWEGGGGVCGGRLEPSQSISNRLTWGIGGWRTTQADGIALGQVQG